MSLPDWIVEEIKRARTAYSLGPEWHIQAKLVDNPGGEEGFNGACKPDAVYLGAEIELARDLAEGELGKRVIWHEVGHAAMAQIDLVVRYILSNIYDESQKAIFQRMYDDAEEQFLQRLTRGLQGVKDAPGDLQPPQR